MRVKLGDIAKINGQSVGNKFPYSKMKYLDTSSITKGIISNIQEFEYPSKDIPSRAQRVVKDKTIIYSTVRPRLCHFGILLNPDKNLIVSTGFVTIDVDEKIADPIYIYNILRDNKITDYLGNIADTAVSSYPSISSNDLRDLEIDILEDLEEQKQIGNFLLSIDKQINTNNEINAELESMAKTLYDYWFLQFEFPNEEGKPYKSSGGKMIWNEELKREIPKGWEVKKVGDILEEANKSKIQVNNANGKGKYPFFTSGESVLAFDEYLVDGFNIFLNTGGNPDIKAYMGKCAYSTDTWCISANEFSYVLYYYLLKFMPQFEQLFFAGSGLKHLQKDSLKNQYILLPDDKTQKRFNNTCVLNWKKTTNCLIVNQELTSLRDFLLPLLMNGQVSLKSNC